MWNFEFSKEELLSFYLDAGKNTYAGGGEYSDNSEREGFRELEYSKGDFHYRDSYTGAIRSRGNEVVKYKGKVVFIAQYGGGMIDEKRVLADEAFIFLKKALMNKGDKFTPRGMDLKENDWSYEFKMMGDFDEFTGHEEIKYKNELVFYHNVIGGLVY